MHNIARLSVAILGSALLGSLPNGPAAAQDAAGADSAALIARGARVYSRECQRCHNPRSPAERTDREWIIILQHMQMRANLSADRAEAVRAFLLASNEPGRASAETGRGAPETPTEASVTEEMIQQGRGIFRGGGGCAACHGARLEGGPIAPSLADARWKHGAGTLADILRIVRGGVPGTAMVAYPGGIRDEEAVRVAAYVWAVAHGRSTP